MWLSPPKGPTTRMAGDWRTALLPLGAFRRVRAVTRAALAKGSSAPTLRTGRATMAATGTASALAFATVAFLRGSSRSGEGNVVAS